MPESFVLTILGMGVAVYATRLAGFWLMQGVAITGRLKVALEAVPPAILTAVIAPTLFLQGLPEFLAGGVTLAAALMRLPLLVCIAIGCATVAVLRLFM